MTEFMRQRGIASVRFVHVAWAATALTLAATAQVASHTNLSKVTGRSSSGHVSTAPAAVALERAATAFVANQGQWERNCLFRARFGPMRCDVHGDGWSVTMLGDTRGGASSTLRFRVDRQGEAPTPVGEKRLPGRRSYFLGDDPARWCSDVPAYESVLLHDVMAGIDIRIRESDGQLKYDVVAARDADFDVLRLHVEGASRLEVDTVGALIAHTKCGPLRQPPPAASSGGLAVACAYRLLGDDRFGFEVADWDRTSELVIDPPLLYSTYLGGLGSDLITSVADTAGPILTVCGITHGNFPVTPIALQGVYGGGGRGWPDAFITQLDLSRVGPAQLVYSTYLGGPGLDGAEAVMLDAQGVITMVGGGSDGFPTTPNAYRRIPRGPIGVNFVVVRLDPSRAGAAQLLYSTFVGGSGQDLVIDAALDANGRVVFCGDANSWDLPTTEGAILPNRPGPGSRNGYVLSMDPSLPPARQVVYCTYVGGRFDAYVMGVAIRDDGALVLGGYTNSDNFLTTPGAYQERLVNTGLDAFAWILDPTRVKDEQLLYGTLLGGFSDEWTRSVAVDPDGVVTIGGDTWSADLPTTPNAFSRTFLGPPPRLTDGFVARFDPRRSGTAQLVYSSYFGGTDQDNIVQVLSANGLVTLLLETSSRDLPTTPGAFQPVAPGGVEVAIAQLDTVRSRLVYSTFLGGTSDDGTWDMVEDEDGVVTVVGGTASFDFPTTPNAYDRTHAGGGLADACLSRLELQADGLARFGRGTRSCTGPVLLRGTAMPRMGNIGFSILCTNAPSQSAGALLLSDRRLSSSVVFAGAELWIDPGAAVMFAMSSSDLQRADAPLPIPGEPGLIGGRLFAQAVWVGPASPPPCPRLGLSTSFGLEITVQP